VSFARPGADRLDAWGGPLDRLGRPSACGAARRLGLPASRWTAPQLLDVLRQAVPVPHRPARACDALLAIAADPTTCSPVRFGDHGPRWDHPDPCSVLATGGRRAARCGAAPAGRGRARGGIRQVHRCARSSGAERRVRRPLTAVADVGGVAGAGAARPARRTPRRRAPGHRHAPEPAAGTPPARAGVGSSCLYERSGSDASTVPARAAPLRPGPCRPRSARRAQRRTAPVPVMAAG
jgi:hypothetical protein